MELAESSTRPASFNLQKGVEGDDQYISLTAHFRVDRSVANEGASSYLKDLLALQLAVLQEAEFEVKVQLNRSDVPSLRFLGIAVNGCQVLCYRDIEVDFDPYCRPDAVRRPSNGDDEWELAPLRGEWIVNRSHPVTAELDIGTRTTGARARLLFPNLGDDVWGLRGSICYAISEAGSGSRVIEPKHTMELLYPEHFVKEDESPGPAVVVSQSISYSNRRMPMQHTSCSSPEGRIRIRAIWKTVQRSAGGQQKARRLCFGNPKPVGKCHSDKSRARQPTIDRFRASAASGAEHNVPAR